ncbi:MAG: hypothetical protein IPH07_15000 [Deltaproteobacteria bacterium]|nr:hypothetical protein [Deltaproteobacteria bacterium]MBP7285796.1 hypothetical protein [Nannocystaceae bacterium]
MLTAAVLLLVLHAPPPATDDDPRAFEGARAVPGDAQASTVAVPHEPDAAMGPADAARSPTTATDASASTDASVSTTASASTTAPASSTTPAKDRKARSYPRLVLAGGALAGPHAFGNEECRSEQVKCEAHGTFFGLGFGAELRARLYRPLYANLRGMFVGNVSTRDPIYRGLVGGAIGVGAYGRRVFARAEYLLLGAFGDNHYSRPFGTGEIGTDRWGHHAGVFSAGARLPLRPRLAAELWGGFMLGPRSVRTLPDEAPERRTLLTFLIGLGVSYDLIPDRSQER